LLHRLQPVARNPNDVDVRFSAETERQAGTSGFFIVGYQGLDWFHTAPNTT